MKRGKKKSTGNLEDDEEMENEIELTESVLEARAMQEKLLLEEERDIIIQELMDELLGNTLDECYKIYMHRQTIAFTVHCACLALMDVIDFYMPSCDPGEPYGADGRPQWSGDKLPVPLNSDIWAGRPLPVCFGRSLKMSPVRYYKSLPNQDKSGHKTGKKNKKAVTILTEAACQHHVPVSDNFGTESEANSREQVELEKPVEPKKKVTPRARLYPEPVYDSKGGIGNVGKMPMPREQREKSMTTADPTKFATTRVNANGSTQSDYDHVEGSYNYIAMEHIPVSKLQVERIEMKYSVLPTDQSKSSGKGKNVKQPGVGSIRKDKKGKPDIINLV